MWRREIGQYLDAGVSNRLIYGLSGELGVNVALGQLARGDAGRLLRRAYGPTLGKRMILPIARLVYRRMLSGPSCAHVDCSGVWCRDCAGHDG